jgi:hypothetical protein
MCRPRSWTPEHTFGGPDSRAVPNAAGAGMSVAARVDGDHFQLPADAVELLRYVRPADHQWFIEEVTQALAVAADTKDFRPLAGRARSVDRDGPPPAATGL